MTATTEKTRYPIGDVLPVLNAITVAIWDACDHFVVAGSIRRKRPTVSDIELVVVPRVTASAVDLFGDAVTHTNQLDLRVREMIEFEGTLEHRLDKNGRPAYGDRYKRLRHVASGIPLDLFSVLPPAQFGVILAIRTGSADFSHRFMTPKSIGGALPNYMLVRDGCLYRHINGADLPVDKEKRRGYPDGWLVAVPTPTERDFFAAIGMDWVEPEGRSA